MTENLDNNHSIPTFPSKVSRTTTALTERDPGKLLAYIENESGKKKYDKNFNWYSKLDYLKWSSIDLSRMCLQSKKLDSTKSYKRDSLWWSKG